MSPTARSLALLREMGYTAQVVEYWHGPSKRRRDLFGCIDIVAAHADHGILGIQATTASNHAARVTKARGCNVGPWLHHAKLEVWSWGKRGGSWNVRRERLRLKDLLE